MLYHLIIFTRETCSPCSLSLCSFVGGHSIFVPHALIYQLVLSAVALLWLCAQLQHTLAERKADGGGQSGGGGMSSSSSHGHSSHGGAGFGEVESGSNGNNERDQMLTFGDNESTES